MRRFGAWVQVRAERLHPQTLPQALHASAYYATQGPRIADVRVDGDPTASMSRAAPLGPLH
jgi:hypothetical protein